MDEAERLMFEGWSRLPSFRRKVEQAKATICEALAIAPAYVACSWGKDSTVLLHLAQQVKPDVQAVFWTDPEQENFGNYNEVIRRYCDRFQPNYLEIDIEGDRVPHKIEASKLWETYPVALIGVRKQEQGKRKYSFKHGLIHQYTTGAWAGSWRVFPLGFWNWEDVWAYCVGNDLPYLDAYDHPAAGDRARSRTCNLLAKQDGNTKGVQYGRIAALRARNPAYYAYLQEFYPAIASAT